jgi:hypothetical protein
MWQLGRVAVGFLGVILVLLGIGLFAFLVNRPSPSKEKR